MDLGELHRRTEIPRRRLRYCLDHELVPELRFDLAPGRAGRPRQFDEDVGFAIVCAVVLLDTGLPHEKIQWFLRGLLGITVRDKQGRTSALAAILQCGGPAFGYLGDGVNVRIACAELDYDSGWVVPENPARVDPGYSPRVEMRLNLGTIRDEVFGMQGQRLP